MTGSNTPPSAKASAASEKKLAPIVIKKVIKGGHAHHGGAWKIAYADFVTAMMAFFLLMWLLSAVNKAKLQGISDYFKQPLKVALQGGPSIGNRSVAVLDGGEALVKTPGQVNNTSKPETKSKVINPVSDKESEKVVESKQLKKLEKKIKKAVSNDPAFSEAKNQVMLSMTKEGLRVELIDLGKNPMFEVGSESLDEKTKKVLAGIAKLLSTEVNKVSIYGHTDGSPYKSDDPKDSNWELSTKRAIAARRALIEAGFDENRIFRVTGYGASMLKDKENPADAKNRRITIVITRKEVQDSASESN